MTVQTVSIDYTDPVNSNDGVIYADLDEEYNKNKSTFIYGDVAYVRLFKSDNVNIDTINITDGSISASGFGIAVIETDLTFDYSNEVSVSIPINVLEYAVWKGNDLGAITIGNHGTKIVSTNSGLGVLHIKYQANFQRYAVSLPPKSDPKYTVLVGFEGVINAA